MSCWLRWWNWKKTIRQKRFWGGGALRLSDEHDRSTRFQLKSTMQGSNQSSIKSLVCIKARCNVRSRGKSNKKAAFLSSYGWFHYIYPLYTFSHDNVCALDSERETIPAVQKSAEHHTMCLCTVFNPLYCFFFWLHIPEVSLFSYNLLRSPTSASPTNDNTAREQHRLTSKYTAEMNGAGSFIPSSTSSSDPLYLYYYTHLLS